MEAILKAAENYAFEVQQAQGKIESHFPRDRPPKARCNKCPPIGELKLNLRWVGCDRNWCSSSLYIAEGP